MIVGKRGNECGLADGPLVISVVEDDLVELLAERNEAESAIKAIWYHVQSMDNRLAATISATNRSEPTRAHSVNGGAVAPRPGCSIVPGGLDAATGTLVFYSSCDPFGTNPYGDQLFAIHRTGRIFASSPRRTAWAWRPTAP
jgi:hypothetical protein